LVANGLKFRSVRLKSDEMLLLAARASTISHAISPIKFYKFTRKQAASDIKF